MKKSRNVAKNDKGKMQMPISQVRLSDLTLVLVNLGLGGLITLANGGALFLTLSAQSKALEGKEFEIALWVILGLTLTLASIFALYHRENYKRTLKVQATILCGLCVLLVGWAITLIFGNPPSTRTIWSLGYLSIASLYAAFLFSRSFSSIKSHNLRTYGPFGFAAICVLVDVATFVRLGGLLS